MTVPFLIREVTVYFSPTENMITMIRMMIRKNMKMNNNNNYNIVIVIIQITIKMIQSIFVQCYVLKL